MNGGFERRLSEGVDVICRECLGLSEREKLLVLADPPEMKVAETIAGCALEHGFDSSLVRIPLVERAGSAPRGFTRELLAQADAALLVTGRSLSHTEARRRACREDGVRVASMPGLTLEMLARLFPAGSAENAASATQSAVNLLEGVSQVRVRAEAGTDITFSLHGRKIYQDNGLYREPGRFGNLPAGEVCASPLESSAEGRIVVDVAFAGLGAVNGLELTVSGGYLAAARGPRAAEVLALLDGPAERVLAEFGIGTNALARTGPLTLEAEKACGTVHFAFGDNRSFGGSNAASGHWDAVLRCDWIEMDGQRRELPRPETER